MMRGCTTRASAMRRRADRVPGSSQAGGWANRGNSARTAAKSSRVFIRGWRRSGVHTTARELGKRWLELRDDSVKVRVSRGYSMQYKSVKKAGCLTALIVTRPYPSLVPSPQQLRSSPEIAKHNSWTPQAKALCQTAAVLLASALGTRSRAQSVWQNAASSSSPSRRPRP